tara:strand:+ start:1443 stop:1658 length:216 start_codon:yes stop_codon:yes gene_type:complete
MNLQHKYYTYEGYHQILERVRGILESKIDKEAVDLETKISNGKIKRCLEEIDSFETEIETIISGREDMANG